LASACAEATGADLEVSTSSVAATAKTPSLKASRRSVDGSGFHLDGARDGSGFRTRSTAAIIVAMATNDAVAASGAAGAFERSDSVFREWVAAGEPGRYHLLRRGGLSVVPSDG